MKPCVPDKLPLKKIEWEPLIQHIGNANRALAYYQGTLNGIRNPSILLAPLTTQEAVLSSRIEGTQATLGEVLRFEAGESPIQESRRLDIEEIMNYRGAMRVAEDELERRPMSLNLLKRLHFLLLDGVRGKDKARGEFRKIQNWIGESGTAIEKARFIPPEPSLVPEYLDNWEKYYHEDQLDPLVHLAIVHAQFEIIHPFIDGNGRIGRMLIPLFLFEHKLLSKPVFYVSAYLDEHKEEYIEKLRVLCSEADAWENWIKFFLKAIADQALVNADKSCKIIQLYNEMKTEILELTRSQHAIPILDHMFERPIFKSNSIKSLPNTPTKATITGLLNTLKEAGILVVIRASSGRRPQILAFPKLLNLCEGSDVISPR
jgi:Fic family protein